MALQFHRTAAATAALLALALAGCATETPSNAGIDAARLRLGQLQSDPTVEPYAAPVLAHADQSLAAAAQANSRGDGAEVDHQLFLADREMSTAEAQAQAAAAKARVAALDKERDRVEAALASKPPVVGMLMPPEDSLSVYQTRETNEGTVVTLYNLPFDTGNANLLPGSTTRLQPLVAFLQHHPDRHVVIEGNTDSTGSVALNETLSQERADAVRDFLVASGVAETQLTARGMGSSLPVASNNTQAGRQENRRVDVIIQQAQSTAPPAAQSMQ